MFISTLIGNNYLPDNLPYFKYVYQLYLSIFLMAKYNPLTKPTLTPLDSEMIFTIASFIFILNAQEIYVITKKYLPMFLLNPKMISKHNKSSQDVQLNLHDPVLNN